MITVYGGEYRDGVIAVLTQHSQNSPSRSSHTRRPRLKRFTAATPDRSAAQNLLHRQLDALGK
ncbi:hypothetical protein ACFY2Z_21000 [Streptomyces sp. NPDC001222]|uniref:hypothetical protein n=1 Tax=Streptomyces sp. NPDC001222 TaxID=3364548 RepID=UPI003676806D